MAKKPKPISIAKADKTYRASDAKKRSDAEKPPKKKDYESSFSYVMQIADSKIVRQKELQKTFGPKKKVTTQAQRLKEYLTKNKL